MTNPKIFKAYDIRGLYPNELNEEAAYDVGRSFAVYLKAKTIIVGRDTRLSSPALAENIIKGITDQGVDVIDIGLCSTSCFYFAVGELDADGALMVTASHAPKEFNGFKPVLRGNVALTREEVSKLKDLTVEGNLPTPEAKGTIIKKDFSDNYVQAVKGSIKEKMKPLKIVLDAGNGMAGMYMEKIFADTGLEVVPLFAELDGNFPNHETNPKIPENRTKLEEAIISEKADLGFMFDGDADRMYILDRQGRVVDPSLVSAIISEYRVKNSSQKKVVIEVRTSKVVRDWVEKAGGSIILSVCWTIPIKLAMQADPEVVFGSETSGHYVFPELHEADDGLMATLAFLQAISVKDESIDEIIKNFKEKYFVLEEINFEMPNMEEADKIFKKLEDSYSAQGAQILKIDGVSVIFPDWKFNLRKSETEPVIRLNLDADSENLFEEKKAEVIAKIKENL